MNGYGIEYKITILTFDEKYSVNDQKSTKKIELAFDSYMKESMKGRSKKNKKSTCI